MRGSRWFIIGIVLFLLIMFVVEYHLPKKFVWNPTFGQHDHQPLGGAVFDDVLKSSLPLLVRYWLIHWDSIIRMLISIRGG